MPIKVGSDLEKVSLVLTTEQVRRLKAIATMRGTQWRRVSLSDVGREVVEAGLATVSQGRDSSIIASSHDGDSSGGGEGRAA